MALLYYSGDCPGYTNQDHGYELDASQTQEMNDLSSGEDFRFSSSQVPNDIPYVDSYSSAVGPSRSLLECNAGFVQNQMFMLRDAQQFATGSISNGSHMLGERVMSNGNREMYPMNAASAQSQTFVNTAAPESPHHRPVAMVQGQTKPYCSPGHGTDHVHIVPTYSNPSPIAQMYETSIDPAPTQYSQTIPEPPPTPQGLYQGGSIWIDPKPGQKTPKIYSICEIYKNGKKCGTKLSPLNFARHHRDQHGPKRLSCFVPGCFMRFGRRDKLNDHLRDGHTKRI